MCTASGPGDADLADSWASQFGLETVHVWGDTEDYMYYTFASQLGGAYPSTMVVALDTMELTYMEVGAVDSASSAIEEILSNPDPCAE